MTRQRRSLGPSRLRKALGALDMTVPLVTVEIDGWGTLTDHDISSITIRRGGTDDVDVLPAVLTIETVPAVPAITGAEVRLTVLDHLRFVGRAGPMTRHDEAGDFTTTITASSWSVLLDRLNREIAWEHGASWASVLILTSDLAAMGVDWSFSVDDSRVWDYRGAPDGDVISYSEAMTAFTGSGISVLSRRDGSAQAISHLTRGDYADAAAGTALTLPRSACTSPTSWEQPNEQYARRYFLRYSDAGGNLQTHAAPYREENITETVVLDREWWRVNPSAQLQTWANALALREASRYWQIPTVTVELLPLARSPKPSHQALYRKLVGMQAGDPVPLGADWGSALQGMYFAAGLDESITADHWSLTISLVPHGHIVGSASPPVRGLTWDTSGVAWDDYTESWDG